MTNGYIRITLFQFLAPTLDLPSVGPSRALDLSLRRRQRRQVPGRPNRDREAYVAQRDTRALVAHLFRRAGFGLRPDELDRFAKLGVQGSVDYLINYVRVT